MSSSSCNARSSFCNRAVSEQTGSRCTTRGTGSAHMVRTTRSRPYSVRRADRITSFGVDWSSAAGFAPGHRGARARDRQGTQGTMYTTEQEYPDGPGRLGERTFHVPGSALVPERTRRPSERARCALPVSQARRHGNQYLPIAEAQAREPPCASTLSTPPDYVVWVTGLCYFSRKLQAARIRVPASTRHSFPGPHSCKLCRCPA
jgi:hypothetical protein